MSELKPPVDIRSLACDAVEVSWFSALCDDDFAFMGVKDPSLKSTWAHCSGITRAADRLGFNNILCPSGFVVGQDTWTFASAVAPLLEQLSLLVAVRCGEIHPGVQARAVATLDHILKGRLTINIISSPLPGEEDPGSKARYQRSREVIEVLKRAWTQNEPVEFAGEFYKLKLPIAPMKPYQKNGGPLLYFGGYSPDAVELCAEHCDVYLMWPETEPKLIEMMTAVGTAAKKHNRTLDYGLRVHVIVRETEAEARAYAQQLVSQLDPETGKQIRNRSLDSASYGVQRQAEMRNQADDEGYVEPNLWTGIGRARSGCGGALVGNADQIAAKLQRYVDMGIRAFILSGYPHAQECELFAKHVLPKLKIGKLAEYQNRIPKQTPATPLGTGPRV